MRAIRKITGIFLIAMTGAFAAIGISNLVSTDNKQSENLSDSRVYPVNYTHLPSLNSSNSLDFVNAAEMTVNSVVHVKTTITTTMEYFDPFQYFFRGGEPQKKPHTQQSAGSGVIISRDGYIATNNHVIANADKIEVVLNNKATYVAKVIGKDPSTDLALIKIEANNLPYINLGNSDDVRLGEWVLAVGNPFNLTSTVTAGIVSAKGRSINILEGDKNPIEAFIQTDAAVNPGNSGGALVNTRGELVGINTAIASGTGYFSGYSFAIPVNIVKKITSDLIEFGEVQRAFLGVSIRDIDATFAKEQNLGEMRGVYVAGLSDNGSAKDAGLKEGDIILKIGNRNVNTVPELQEQISRFRPGDKVDVTVKRNGKERNVSVVLKSLNGSTNILKADKDKKTPVGALGAVLEPVSKEEKKQLKLEGGAKVSQMGPGKLQAAGIREGFIITRIDKNEIKSPEDVTNALNNLSGGVLIEGIYPNGMRAYYGFGI